MTAVATGPVVDGCRADRPGGGDPTADGPYAGRAVRWRASGGDHSTRKVEQVRPRCSNGAARRSSPPRRWRSTRCRTTLRCGPRPGPASTYRGPVRRHHRPGPRRWFEAAASWDARRPARRARRRRGIARGPKSVGALRSAHGLRERWSPPSECFDDVLAYLRGSTLTGRRIVVQARLVAVGGRQRAAPAGCLGRDGHRVPLRADDDQAAMFRMVDLVVDRRVDAVTFTSAPPTSCSTSRRLRARRSSRRSATACSPPASARSPRRRSSCTASRCSSPAAPASPRWSAPRGRPAQPARRDRARRAWPPAAAPRRQRLRRRGGGRAVAGAAGGAAGAGRAPGHVVSRRELLGHRPAATPGASTVVEVAVGFRLRAVVGPRPGADGRQARLPPAGHLRRRVQWLSRLVTVAHGTRAAEGPKTIRGLVRQVARRMPNVDVVESYVEPRRAELLVGDGVGLEASCRSSYPCCCPPATTSPPTCRRPARRSPYPVGPRAPRPHPLLAAAAAMRLRAAGAQRGDAGRRSPPARPTPTPRWTPTSPAGCSRALGRGPWSRSRT